MYNKLEDQIIIMQAMNDKLASEFTEMKSNMKNRYSESTKMRSDMKNIKTMLNRIVSKKDNYLPHNMHTPKAQDTSSMFPSNKKDSPLKGRHSMKIGVMWNLKHEIRSPKFY